MSATEKNRGVASPALPAPPAAANHAPPKRRRGRPRKNPLSTGIIAPAPAPPIEGKRRRGRPPKHARAAEAPPPNYSDINAPEVQEKLRFLVRLAKEQDYLTFDDLNETLPNGFVTTELL